MATKKKPAKKTTTTTTVEEPELEQEREELDVFDRAKLEFSGPTQAKLTIYRYDDGDTSYLKRVGYDPSVIDEEWIRKKFGAGTYQLRFQDPEVPQRVWSKIVSISPEQPLGSPSPSSSGEAVYLETLRRQNEIMLQGLLTRLAAPSPGAPAAAAGGDAIVTIIQGIQAQNAELLRASLNRPDTSATILTVLERGMAIAAEAKLDSEGGWASQIGRIAKDVLPALQEIMRARPMPAPPIGIAGAGRSPAARGNGVPPALGPGGGVVDTNPGGGGGASSPAPSSSSSPSSPSSGPSATGGGGGAFNPEQLIREFAPSILEAIQRGTSPTELADAILAYIPPALYGEFEKLSTESVVQLEPKLAQHRDYVGDLVASLQDTGDDGGGDGENAA